MEFETESERVQSYSMEAFNQQVSAVQTLPTRFVRVILCLTLLIAMASAKLHTHIFVVRLLTFNIIHFKCNFALKRLLLM